MLMTERERLAGEIQALAEKHGKSRTALIPMVQEIKRRYRRLDGYAMQVIADQLGIHPVEVYSVVSFYAFLGSEAHGIAPELAARVTRKITIPAFGAAESLNVAVATAIICDNLRRSSN